jgi:hypothetical protein
MQACPPVAGCLGLAYGSFESVVPMPNRRSPDAAMSTFELRALRCVGEGLPQAIEPAHRDLLIRMGLARVKDVGGDLELTEDGARRLAAEAGRAPRAS